MYLKMPVVCCANEEACKQRAAEIRDELLFKQPESTHLGDCPICFLPLALEENSCAITNCCFKSMCHACEKESARSEFIGGHYEMRCAFCRLPRPSTHKEVTSNMMKRAKKNNPTALQKIGEKKYEEGEFAEAFEYYSRAASLGNVISHFHLAHLYLSGKGVEYDEEMVRFHFTKAAIGGHTGARFCIGKLDYIDGKFDRAVKHLVITAKLGDRLAMPLLLDCYKEGHISKDDYAMTLRAHQAALDEMKCPKRDQAEEISKLADFIRSQAS